MSVRHSPQWKYGRGMAANKKTVLVINGPNLNLLGQRQPEIYGTATLEDHINRMVEIGSATGLKITAFQSNSSGEIVDRIHAARGKQSVLAPVVHGSSAGFGGLGYDLAVAAVDSLLNI